MGQDIVIYNHLLTRGSITTREAFELYGCVGVAGVIDKLKEAGVKVRKSTVRVKCKNGMQSYVIKYTLTELPRMLYSTGLPKATNGCQPCIFCGNTEINEYMTENGSYMSCDRCKISTDIGKTSDEATYYWNRLMSTYKKEMEQ